MACATSALCSNEVWTATLTADFGVASNFSLTWAAGGDRQPALLPFPGRCGAALIAWNPLKPDAPAVEPKPPGTLIGVVGGQLSYDDASCLSLPQYSSEAYYTQLAVNDSAGWYRGADAPFSPRRSQQRDDSFVRLRTTNGLVAMPAVALVGGLRVLAHSVDALSGVARLTRVELFADVWQCSFMEESNSTEAFNVSSSCVWGTSLHFPSNSTTDSAPLPVTGAPHMGAIGGVGGVRIGGATSVEGISAFRQLLPGNWMDPNPLGTANLSELAINATMILSPQMEPYPTLLTEVMQARGFLPLSQVLGEAELNGPSPYTLGSDYVVTHLYADRKARQTLLHTSTVHHQPWAMADTAEMSTWFTPQAASSLNTSRPRFNFPLRRLGHGSSLRSHWTVWGWQFLSGGRSGEVYNNDWIRLYGARCSHPADHAYAAALGPLQLLTFDDYDYPFILTSTIRVECAPRHHWEPPSPSPQVPLVCLSNGMWQSLNSRTVQRCVSDVLNCSWPEVDVGGLRCEEPRPVVHSLTLDKATNVDDTTVRYAPVTGGSVLAIYGAFFAYPISVTVGGYECEEPVLWFDSSEQSAACNSTSTCQAFAPQVRCVLPPLFGINLNVLVESGQRGLTATTLSGQVASISSTPPALLSVNSSECSEAGDGSSLHLVDCPIEAPFALTVAVDAASVVLGHRLLVFLADTRPLECSEWRGLEHPWGEVLYATCTVHPRLGQSLHLGAHQATLLLESIEDAWISFRTCRPGSSLRYSYGALNNSSASFCQPCPPGSSTGGLSGALSCTPCAAGLFADSAGASTCTPCGAGTFSPAINATVCQACPINSWVTVNSSTRCSECDLDRYISFHPQPPNAVTPPSFSCMPCPASAMCDVSGNITAQEGSFLLVTDDGLLSSVQCPSSACSSGGLCLATEPMRLAGSGLPVWNCCREGRLPAFDSTNDDLRSTLGVNVLCAHCQSGYSLINGRCIECSSVQWLPLLAVLGLYLGLIYLLHRVPHNWSGSAQLSICMYFLQVAIVFIASDALPQLLTVTSLSILGDHVVRGLQSTAASGSSEGMYIGYCVVPLDAVGRVVMQLLSPVLAIGLLSVLMAVQLAARALLKLGGQRSSTAEPLLRSAAAEEELQRRSVAQRAYHAVFAHSSSPVVRARGRRREEGRAEAVDVEALRSPERAPTSIDERVHSHLIRLSYQRTLVRLVLLAYLPLSSSLCPTSARRTWVTSVRASPSSPLCHRTQPSTELCSPLFC